MLINIEKITLQCEKCSALIDQEIDISGMNYHLVFILECQSCGNHIFYAPSHIKEIELCQEM